jgi:hypothetical protein
MEIPFTSLLHSFEQSTTASHFDSFDSGTTSQTGAKPHARKVHLSVDEYHLLGQLSPQHGLLRWADSLHHQATAGQSCAIEGGPYKQSIAMSQYPTPPHLPPYAPRPWSPQQGMGSPHPGNYPPPSKRPRLSPNPPSPYGSPSLANISLPNQIFSRPFPEGQQNGYPTHANNYHNTLNHVPQPPQPPPHAMGTMGPPSRPSDKPTDLNELSDVLLGSGVDIQEEEAALRNRNSVQQQHDTSLISQLATSFNSAGSGSPQNPSLPPRFDYNHYSHNIPGDRSSFYGAGTFNQLAKPHQAPEEWAKKAREQADRRKAETRQYHLNEPFLYTGPLHRRVDKQIRLHHLSTNINGHYKPNGNKQPTQVRVFGPDKHERLEVLTDQHLITSDSPLVDILALLSLAAGERIRDFIEDAAALAKSRQIGSQGVVPVDLQDLAVGDGKAETVPALPTPSNSAVSPKTNPLKRMLATYVPTISLLIAHRILRRLQYASHSCIQRRAIADNYGSVSE